MFTAPHSWFQINVIIELNVHLWNRDFIFLFRLGAAEKPKPSIITQVVGANLANHTRHIL